jgi:hypothetical protein
MLKNSSDAVEKIDVEDLIKDFKILSIDNFQAYLKEVWRVRHDFKHRTCLKGLMTKLKELTD